MSNKEVKIEKVKTKVKKSKKSFISSSHYRPIIILTSHSHLLNSLKSVFKTLTNKQEYRKPL